ncbi:hypothetical protein GCM10023220_42890 [Streptomyces ziwulingensis]|uniref:Uncharacterized protein n=1 Tax=Streptomyces ziwulingensis TaxID=1045501 RepID=A0ABP9CBP3_9ACTN
MREPSRRLTRTRGGSRETDRKAVAVIPAFSPSGAPGSSGSSGGSCAVSRTTPEARWDIAARNASLLTPSACPAAAGDDGDDGDAGDGEGAGSGASAGSGAGRGVGDAATGGVFGTSSR